MTERSASAAVTVSVDPLRAFEAFTDEIDAWWVRGPINFFDSSRAVEMRIEPDVGGRVLEVYENGALELGRITAWEPGTRLAYRSSVDDTTVEVSFERVDDGTRVRVTQELVDGGDRALYFWPTVLRWFASWPERRGEIACVSIALRYEDPAAAARWLARVFQLGSWSGIPAEGEQPEWIELHHGNVAIMLFAGDAKSPDVLWVYVDDLDSHFAHTRAEGAAIVSGIEQTGYRAYSALDLEGRRWTFAQARPTMR